MRAANLAAKKSGVRFKCKTRADKAREWVLGQKVGAEIKYDDLSFLGGGDSTSSLTSVMRKEGVLKKIKRRRGVYVKTAGADKIIMKLLASRVDSN